MLRLREFGATLDSLDFRTNTGEFGLAAGEFETEASEIALHLLVAKLGGKLLALGVAKFHGQLFK